MYNKNIILTSNCFVKVYVYKKIFLNLNVICEHNGLYLENIYSNFLPFLFHAIICVDVIHLYL